MKVKQMFTKYSDELFIELKNYFLKNENQCIIERISCNHFILHLQFLLFILHLPLRQSPPQQIQYLQQFLHLLQFLHVLQFLHLLLLAHPQKK